MNLLRNVVGLLFFIGILLPFIGYYPITTLIAWRQAENAKNWETTKCIAICGSDKKRATIRYSYEFWINYGFKSRLEQPKMLSFEMPPKDDFTIFDPALSKAERSKRLKEYNSKRFEALQERQNKEREDREKYERQFQIFEKEQQKLMSQGTKYFSVFQIDGWRYWGNHGWREVCYDEFRNLRKPRFETDCYIDPNNPEKAVFYRELGLNWFWTIALILNTCLMFGFLYLAFYLFVHGMKRKRKTSSSLFTN